MEISSLVEKQRAFFQKGITKTPQFRQKALERLEKESDGMRRKFIRLSEKTWGNQSLRPI